MLRIYSGQKRAYNQEDVVFLTAVAEITGVVIMNAQLYEKIQHDLSFWNSTLDYLGGKNPEAGNIEN